MGDCTSGLPGDYSNLNIRMEKQMEGETQVTPTSNAIENIEEMAFNLLFLRQLIFRQTTIRMNLETVTIKENR